MDVIVEVRDVRSGAVLFAGAMTPDDESEFMWINHEMGKPARMACCVSDLSARASDTRPVVADGARMPAAAVTPTPTGPRGEWCLDCGRAYADTPWRADDALFVAVIGSDAGMYCPPCFGVRAAAAGFEIEYWVPTPWPVTPTPQGRWRHLRYAEPSHAASPSPGTEYRASPAHGRVHWEARCTGCPEAIWLDGPVTSTPEAATEAEAYRQIVDGTLRFGWQCLACEAEEVVAHIAEPAALAEAERRAAAHRCGVIPSELQRATEQQRYEPCVTGSDGRCTRWSHDHAAEHVGGTATPADQPDETVEQGATLTALVLRDIADHLARGDAMIDGDWKPFLPPVHSRQGAKYRRGYSDRGIVAIHALRSVAEMNDPTPAPADQGEKP